MWAGIDCNNFCQNDNDVVESLNTFILGKKVSLQNYILHLILMVMRNKEPQVMTYKSALPELTPKWPCIAYKRHCKHVVDWCCLLTL